MPCFAADMPRYPAGCTSRCAAITPLQRARAAMLFAAAAADAMLMPTRYIARSHRY